MRYRRGKSRSCTPLTMTWGALSPPPLRPSAKTDSSYAQTLELASSRAVGIVEETPILRGRWPSAPSVHDATVLFAGLITRNLDAAVLAKSLTIKLSAATKRRLLREP